MNLHSYIDLHQLLQHAPQTHEKNRAFALEHNLLSASPQHKLAAWTKGYRDRLPSSSQGTQFCRYLYGVSLVLGVIALLLGVVTGVGLLSYSGKEPVNLIYFLAVAVFVPLSTMLLALLSMLRANQAQSLLVHISPAYWMEKILGFLPSSTKQTLSQLKVNPLLLNWLVIQRSQLLALLFALGLLAALLGIVATKDIAFAWSTTLQISPEQFHAFVETLAWPWQAWLPSAVPPVELIEKSQYFRLGGKLDEGMIVHAQALGAWWKFLALATAFYAVLLRSILWGIAKLGFGRALSVSFLSLNGADTLLHEMQTPIVSSTATQHEPSFIPSKEQYRQTTTSIPSSYDVILGWAMNDEGITLLNDSMQTSAKQCHDVGGTNTLQEDAMILKKIEGEVLLYVKAWEPPTMDIMDFVEELAQAGSRVIVAPVGTAAQGYEAEPKALGIWSRKLAQYNHPKVWLWQKS